MGNQKYKKKHKELGLCTQCSEPVMPFSSRCFKHTLSHQDNSMAYTNKNRDEVSRKKKAIRVRYKSEGRCPDCGGPTHDGLITCVNCRQRLYSKPRMSNENYPKRNAP